MANLLGYRYCIVEMTPGDLPAWDQVRRLDYRDNIKDAQTIIDALEATDIDYSVYAILAEPVYSTKG